MNLLDNQYIDMVKNHYKVFKSQMELIGADIPQNLNRGDDKDLLLRKLDCAVINALHYDRDINGEKPFDSVRGMFIEGDTLYKNSGFREKAHIQIAVRNPNCIKGYFSPLSLNSQYDRM